MLQRVVWAAVLAIAVAAVGCKDQGPQGLDPVVLAKNQQNVLPVVITWFDQSGQVQVTPVPANGQTCIHFTSTLATDSVRYVVTVGDTTGANGPWAKQWSPWFDPLTGVTADAAEYPFGAEYWTLTVGAGGGVEMGAVERAPC